MRLLLTGAGSELGRRLYRRLKTDSRLSGARFVLLRHRASLSPKPGDEVVDASLLALAPFGPLDGVIHLAGVSHAAAAEDYERVNVEGTRRLIQAVRRSGVRQFIYMSSRCLGASGGAYSRSKELAERAVRESGLPWTVFRPAEIIGEQYGRGLTQFLSLADRWGVFPVIVSKARVTLAPISLEAAVEAVARAVLEERCLGKTYTLAGPRDYSFADIWRLLRRGPRRVLPLPVPLAALRAACAVNAVYPVFGSLAPDQARRLAMPKSSDSSQAARDLDFKPLPLEELLLG